MQRTAKLRMRPRRWRRKLAAEAASITGAELSKDELDVFAQAAKLELVRLREAAANCQKRIAAQMDTVIHKRRDLRLLERLHERKLAEWKADLRTARQGSGGITSKLKFSARYRPEIMASDLPDLPSAPSRSRNYRLFFSRPKRFADRDLDDPHRDQLAGLPP